jgi:hypothetical protein
VTWLGAALPAFLLAFWIDLFVPAAARLFLGQRLANVVGRTA